MLLREAGLDTDMLNMAGTAGGLGANAHFSDKEPLLDPLPGLGGGDDDEDDRGHGREQRKSQAGVRVYDTDGGLRGPRNEDE